MTPERKKFLANISKEERVIRENLDKAKLSLRIAKKNAFRYGGRKPPEELAGGIKYRKIIIKALKKQLPAPMKEEIFYNVKVFSCPVCDAPLDVCVEDYCFKCGQKLR